MRIISSQLRQIIREEITRTLRESYWRAESYETPEEKSDRSSREEKQKRLDMPDANTSANELIKKLTNSGKDVSGLITFFEREKDSSKRGDELYVLKKNSKGDVGVYMYITWPAHPQHRIDIPKDIAMAAGIAYPKL